MRVCGGGGDMMEGGGGGQGWKKLMGGLVKVGGS